MSIKNLKIARKKIDKLDNQIFILIKKRTRIIKHMVTLKKFKKQIVDHKRINEILKKIKDKSIRDGIDPKMTVRIWKSIIWSYVNYQKKNFGNK